MSFLRRLFGPRRFSQVSSPSELKWDRFRAATHYFILHHFRDQRLARTVYFHPEDFKYNQVLNEILVSKGFDPPSPAESDSYMREETVTHWIPRYFPDKDGGVLFCSQFKDELVSIAFVTTAAALEDIGNRSEE